MDEEFANLDPDDKEAERPPDISKLTLSLEEMAPHTNPRYGRDEIDLGNMFADFFKPIARYNSERGIWFVYDGVVWQPDMENLMKLRKTQLSYRLKKMNGNVRKDGKIWNTGVALLKYFAGLNSNQNGQYGQIYAEKFTSASLICKVFYGKMKAQWGNYTLLLNLL